jgi:hypothetical protein
MSPADVNEKIPSVGFSMSKTYEQMARAIATRFLPEYFRIYHLLEEKRNNIDGYEAARNSMADRLISTGIVQKTTWNDGLWSREVSEIRVDGPDSVTMKLIGIEGDLAIQILELVKEYDSRKEQK